tara:strand:+ start:599074 stop:599196 length:123 start_codon:yes stop_codon:yes gene_type:complete
MRKGVVRNPPPTPKNPDKNPTHRPRHNMASTEIDISAMGR